MVNVQRPSRSGSNVPSKRSLPSGRMGASAHSSSPGPRTSTVAATRSWPSAKASALTLTVSPTVRFDGQRPSSMEGTTPLTTTRAGGLFRRERVVLEGVVELRVVDTPRIFPRTGACSRRTPRASWDPAPGNGVSQVSLGPSSGTRQA